MTEQAYLLKMKEINTMPINKKAYDLMVEQREPIMMDKIHAVQATLLAMDENLVKIKNPQLEQAMYLTYDSKDPEQIVKILDLANLKAQDLPDLASQILEFLDMHLTETVQGYPNLQA